MLRSTTLGLVIVGLSWCGCGDDMSVGLESGETSDSAASDGEGRGEKRDDGVLDALRLLPGHEVNTGRVATASACADCHSNSDFAQAMRDEAGRGVAPYDLWQSSMMANAARDPFWHAMVEGELLTTPNAAEAIEAKCTRCHAPLLSAELELTGAKPPSLASLYEPNSDHAALGLDGVSCTLCHQIEDQQLGQPASFSGKWIVAGAGRIYGPHADPFTMPMVNRSGMLPVEGHQLLDSATCGTCHTLFTDALTPDGGLAGASLAEQTPYLEWRNSRFSTERSTLDPQAASCQDCHVPKRSVDGQPISTAIARRPPGDDFPSQRAPNRDPFGRHVFVGANTMMLQVIRDQAEVLRPNASAEAFDATIAATRSQLEHATAELEIAGITRDGDTLRIPVTVKNLAGHKLPTGFPSRRVFLWIEVRDANEQLVFRSGAHDQRGRLLDGAGELLACELAGGPVEPHHDDLSQPDQAQIWEAVMADIDGAPTYRLLRGATFLKDNRLLPSGWDPQLVIDAIAPAGVDGDLDFKAAGDTVTYVVTAPAAAGPYRVEARVYYQTASPRFLAELFVLEGPRIRAFEAMLASADLQPERLATAQAIAN
jgi:hypothetical protein